MNPHYSIFAEQYKCFREIFWFYGRLVMLIAMLCVASGTALAANSCTNTATAAFKACHSEAQDDFWIATGNCYNLSDPSTSKECSLEAKTTLKEDKALCGEQRVARLEICDALGGEPYDPEINPANFVDPAEIGKSIDSNRYFPLLRGRTWTYKGGTETNTVTVTNDTKTILGVPCAVVHDVVEDNGEVIEDTKDWFAQDRDGNVWYFGEISQEFEDGELVSINGSWKAGVEGAKAGIIMKAAPAVGDVYRQEFSLGNAEDMAEVLSLTGSATVPAASCDGNCLVTKEFTPLDPDAVENKYYALDVGQILVVNSETGEREELVEVIDAP